jgi:hypothetical protein
VAANGAAESRRKTRTLAGNYQILALEPRLLIPVVNPVWIQYLSHKLGRLVTPWALLAVLASSVALAPQGWPYAMALLLQLCFYSLAIFGGVLESKHRLGAGPAEELERAASSRRQRS